MSDDCPMNYRRMPVQEAHLPENGDKVCWFCGSWDREAFVAFCRRILSGEVSAAYEIGVQNPATGKPWRMPRLELSDRRHKIYARQDGVSNASEGAIKFYVAHLMPADVDVVNEALAFCRKAAATEPS